MKKLMLVISALTLAACSTPAKIENTAGEFNPQSQARVRLFGQNQKPSSLFFNVDCGQNPAGEKISTGGSLGEAFGSFTGTVKSKSIGIAQTETTRHLGSYNGILSRAFFREFVIPAGKPVNVRADYIGLTTVSETPTHRTTMIEGSCQSKVGSFVPQAGKDYEVIGVKGRACGVSVQEVAKDGSLSEVPLGQEVRCRKK